MTQSRRSRGAAMITVLVALVVVTSVGVAITAHTSQALSAMQVDRDCTRARLAAEGGIEAARAALRGDPSWSGGAFEIGGVTATVTVRTVEVDVEVSDAHAHARERIVDSRAPGAVIEATLRLRDGLPTITRWRER